MERMAKVVWMAAAAAGCFGGGDGQGASGSETDSLTLLESCSGTYLCQGPSDPEPFEGYLEPRGSDCAVGDVLLHVDGSISAPGVDTNGFEWSGDVTSFDICAPDGSCLTCQRPDEPADSPAEPALECSGFPPSCSSLVPGSCSTVDGCYLGFHVRYDGSMEPECKGVSEGCSYMYDEYDCERQGCIWG